METFLSRYKNLTALFAVVLAQLLLLAYQIKSEGEVRLLRVWAIASVTPLARVIETVRMRSSHLLGEYLLLVGTHAENQRIKKTLDDVTLENQFLRTQLATAERAKVLALFQETSRSKTIAARVIGNATGSATHVVILDRGTISGIENGMAVITPQGIVGKITGVYPNASYVLLITDPSFAAGVISQKGRAEGTLRGRGDGVPAVERIANEFKVEPGEWFYTSGDDRIFPKGLPAGQVISVRAGKLNQEIQLRPSGLANGLEEVLVVLNGVHGAIPDARPANQPVTLLPPPPEEKKAESAAAGNNINAVNNANPANMSGTPSASANPGPSNTGGVRTDADRLLDQYRKIGASLGHVFGQSSNGAPNYNINLKPATNPEGMATAPGALELPMPGQSEPAQSTRQRPALKP
jgi:rod shape-determining protein MreC